MEDDLVFADQDPGPAPRLVHEDPGLDGRGSGADDDDVLSGEAVVPAKLGGVTGEVRRQRAQDLRQTGEVRQTGGEDDAPRTKAGSVAAKELEPASGLRDARHLHRLEVRDEARLHVHPVGREELHRARLVVLQPAGPAPVGEGVPAVRHVDVGGEGERLEVQAPGHVSPELHGRAHHGSIQPACPQLRGEREGVRPAPHDGDVRLVGAQLGDLFFHPSSAMVRTNEKG